MGRRSGRGAPSPLASEDRQDAVGAAQALDPVLAGRDAVLGLELVGDEPVPEGRVVGVDLPCRVDEVGIGPVPRRDGTGFPLVERLGCRIPEL